MNYSEPPDEVVAEARYQRWARSRYCAECGYRGGHAIRCPEDDDDEDQAEACN